MSRSFPCWAVLILSGLVMLYALILLPGRWLDLGAWLLLCISLPPFIWGLFPGAVSALTAHGFGRVLKIVLLCAYGIFFLSFGIITDILVRESQTDPDPGAQAVIVLGAGLWDGEPSPALAQRLEGALAYAEENPSCLVVVSGGQGIDEPCSEASAMKRYLLERNFPEDRILTEDRSTSTLENFRFSKTILDERLGTDYRVVFVTTDFHILRARATARHAGLLHAQGLAVPGNTYFLPIYYAREYLAVIKLFLFGMDGMNWLSKIF